MSDNEQEYYCPFCHVELYDDGEMGWQCPECDFFLSYAMESELE